MANAGFCAKKLDDEINYVKVELHGIGVQKKKLVIRLGEAFEGVIKSESICKEIKKVLKDEIEQELISHRLIEQYCLPKWKKETRPKKKKNEETSFSPKPVMPIVVDTKGNENPIPASDDIPPSFPEDSDPQSKNNEINSPNTECPDCKVHIQKIQDLEGTNRELEEALKKSSAFTTADIGLATRSQEKKEFGIPIDIDETLRYIQRLRHTGNLSNIMWVTAYIEIDTGRSISVHLGEPYENT
jgi:hypothetical protein